MLACLACLDMLDQLRIMPASLPCSSWVWGKLAWLISEGLGERGQGLMRPLTIIGCPWAECALFLTTAALYN